MMVFFVVHSREEEFKMMVDDVYEAFIDGIVNIDSLLMKLKDHFATEDKKISLFEEICFECVTSIKALFEVLDNYWNLYDHDVLAFLVDTAKCEEASKILKEFISSASDLVYHCPVQAISRNKTLRIKVTLKEEEITKEGIIIGKKTIENIKIMIIEFFRLVKCAMVFKCATVVNGCQGKKQCIAIEYLASDSVMIHIQKHMPTTHIDFKKRLDQKGIVSIHYEDKCCEYTYYICAYSYIVFGY